MKDGKEALKQLALTVDHTVLKLDATSVAIDGLCSEARTESFKVCCSRNSLDISRAFTFASMINNIS
jgi:deoxyribose-phosphate aldolase